MADNLRIVYKNLADTGTLTANVVGSVATSILNARNNYRSLVYRTPTVGSGTIEALILLDLGTANVVDSVALALTNLSSYATIRVYASNSVLSVGGTVAAGVLTGTPAYDSGAISALPYIEAGKTYWGESTRALDPYNSSGYARVFTSNSVAYRYWVIRVTDSFSNNPAGFIQFSRLILGKYWSPTYNTSFSGLSFTDSKVGSSYRSESGDLITSQNYSYSTLSLPLKYLNDVDRLELLKLVKTTDFIFVSTFPNSGDKEKAFQVYGKISNSAQITHPVFSMYSSKLDIESI